MVFWVLVFDARLLFIELPEFLSSVHSQLGASDNRYKNGIQLDSSAILLRRDEENFPCLK
jgi:hypothetical protein